MRAKFDRDEIAKDWGEAHQLLDYLQVAVEHANLTSRVRFLVDHLVAAVGWPTGAPPCPPRHPVPLLEARVLPRLSELKSTKRR